VTDDVRNPHPFTEALALGSGLWLQASGEKFRLHRLAPWEPARGSDARTSPPPRRHVDGKPIQAK
jgi:hypothetical protein